MPVSLIDAFTRHQVYLEGYKGGLDPRLDPVLMGLREDVEAALVAAEFDKLNDLTRVQLNRVIRVVASLQVQANNKFRAEMLQELRALAYEDTKLNVRVMEHVEDRTVQSAIKLGAGLPLLGLLALQNNRAGRTRLWALVSSSPDPATGLAPRGLVTQYLRYITRNVRQLIVRGYANGWTLQQTMQALFGTKSLRFRDGFMHRAKRAGASMLHTVVQHISSVVQAGVASLFYRNYEWVSVLDSFTSKICRFRDGLIYEYRKGPLPPAHYRCRSRAVPIKAGATYAKTPNTFYGWAKQQPAAVQNDLVGPRVAGGIRSGRVGADGLGRFKARNTLTLAQFTDKFDIIILS